jgi:nitrate/TMAO reductase-like tetraheme cytochrome c subunit
LKLAYEYARVHQVPDAMFWANQSRKEELEKFSGTIEEREKIVKKFIQEAQELLEVPVNFLEKCGGFEVYEDWLKHNQIS